MEGILNEVTAFVEGISGGNQMISGAIMLWLMGTATYLAKDVPARLGALAYNYCVTTLTFTSAGYQEEKLMAAFMVWLQPKLKEGFSRTLSVQSYYEAGEKHVLGIGFGTHLFFHNRRLFWVQKASLESSGSEREKDRVTVSTLGRSHKPFKEMFSQFSPPSDDDKSRVFHLQMDGEWRMYCATPKRPLATIAASAQLKGSLVDQIKHFKENRDWYTSRGLPHKLTYLLHGVPGGGKTSLIKAVASEFDMNICVININSVSDKSLEMGLASVPKNALVLFEDFDSSPATKNRGKVNVIGESDKESVMQSLTLTGLLNTLDGVVPLDNCVVFLTTNHLEKIDKALYRKGRVDHLVEIGLVDAGDVRDYVSRVFPDADLSAYEFLPTLGCKLNEALLQGKDGQQAFFDALVDNGSARCLTGGE